MATLGVCAYCEQPAARTCKLCGKPICDGHTDDAETEVCIFCARGGTVEGDVETA